MKLEPILSPNYSNFQTKVNNGEGWDSRRESNLIAYQMHGLPLSLHLAKTSVQNANNNAARFHKRPLEILPILPYWKYPTGNDVKDLHTRAPPFPHLHRPQPPPFPIPIFEAGAGTLNTVEKDLVNIPIPLPNNQLPKIANSVRDEEVVQQSSQKLDPEWKPYSLTSEPKLPKLEKLNISSLNQQQIDPNVRSRKEKPLHTKSKNTTLPLFAEQIKNWQLQLRKSNGESNHLASTNNNFNKTSPPPPPEKLERPKSPKWPTQLKQLPSPQFDDTFLGILSKYKQRDEMFRNLQENSKNQEDKIDFEMSVMLAYLNKLGPKEKLIPNQTIKAVETDMKEHITLRRTNDRSKGKRRFPHNFNKKVKFYVSDGLPTWIEPKPNGNTYGAADTLHIPYKSEGFGCRKARKFVMDMQDYKDAEISFEIQGQLITVTGIRPIPNDNKKDQNTKRRRSQSVTQTILLPEDINLNNIRISRDFIGRIVIEEIWDF